MLKALKPTLAIARAMALTLAIGSIEAIPFEVQAAETQAARIEHVVGADQKFALNLYRQLAAERVGGNLFFSPFSIVTALAMTAEGARDETAEEMYRVLGASEAVGDVSDAQFTPGTAWKLRTDMASLRNRLTHSQVETAETKAIRARIAKLQRQLASANQQIARLERTRQWDSISAAQKQAKKLADQLNSELVKVDQYEIRIANALWGERTYPFRQEFVDAIDRNYDTGGLFSVDFLRNAEAARLQINGWVEDQTNKRITDLIPGGVLDEQTRLVLTNAIYFKGDWSEPFEEELTKEENFTLADGGQVKAPMMRRSLHKTARYTAFNADGSLFETPRMIERGQKEGLYPGSDGFAMVELPYRGGEISMVVIAPNRPGGLATLEERLTSANLSNWIDHLKQRETRVHLPKFKLQTDYTLGSNGLEPDGPLPRLGMVRAFVDPGDQERGAQFDGMCASPDPRHRLHISKVLHKVFLEVNEKGTEAAAAISVELGALLSAVIAEPFIPVFQADRPFIFLIRDTSTGSILFLGRMMEPTSAT